MATEHTKGEQNALYNSLYHGDLTLHEFEDAFRSYFKTQRGPFSFGVEQFLRIDDQLQARIDAYRVLFLAELAELRRIHSHPLFETLKDTTFSVDAYQVEFMSVYGFDPYGPISREQAALITDEHVIDARAYYIECMKEVCQITRDGKKVEIYEDTEVANYECAYDVRKQDKVYRHYIRGGKVERMLDVTDEQLLKPWRE